MASPSCQKEWPGQDLVIGRKCDISHDILSTLDSAIFHGNCKRFLTQVLSTGGATKEV